jgi:hypothetical protein
VAFEALMPLKRLPFPETYVAETLPITVTVLVKTLAFIKMYGEPVERPRPTRSPPCTAASLAVRDKILPITTLPRISTVRVTLETSMNGADPTFPTVNVSGTASAWAESDDALKLLAAKDPSTRKSTLPGNPSLTTVRYPVLGSDRKV